MQAPLKQRPRPQPRKSWAARQPRSSAAALLACCALRTWHASVRPSPTAHALHCHAARSAAAARLLWPQCNTQACMANAWRKRRQTRVVCMCVALACCASANLATVRAFLGPPGIVTLCVAASHINRRSQHARSAKTRNRLVSGEAPEGMLASAVPT